MMQISRRGLLIAGAGLLTARPGLALGANGKPRRIVSLGSDVTEIIHALGAGASIVGRDSSSVNPEAAKAAPDLGYFRAIGAEGVLSLNPTLVLASASAGPPETLKQVQAAGVTVIRMPEEFTAEALIEKVRIASDALDAGDAGRALTESLKKSLGEALQEVSQMNSEPRTLFLLNARDGAPMAAGKGTAADGILSLARTVNVFSAHSGYKPISFEAAAAAAPEAIILMQHTLIAMGGVDAVVAHPALKLTPAARDRRIVARDGNYLLGFGPRLPQVIKDLALAVRQGAA